MMDHGLIHGIRALLSGQNRMQIARTFTFDAAHRLPHHDGKCHRMHGHGYRLELVFSGTPRLPRPEEAQSGFLVDFGLLDRIIRTELITPKLDHFLLNESLPELPYHSAEYLAAWIVGWCMTHLDGRKELGTTRIDRARLWESERAWAEASRADAMALGFANA
ncbi:MAG: 6-carboxytetrahydropterin synthase [Magnetococcales bacterium]|nr:6-carboxytetrahydropterin synthase [Magnetococcales bacterium]NGZ06233.1 6-carboxytetrahydropterin synthase [Magnetococcales bacterium]